MAPEKVELPHQKVSKFQKSIVDFSNNLGLDDDDDGRDQSDQSQLIDRQES